MLLFRKDVLLTLKFISMKRKFTESQIVSAIKKQRNDIAVNDLCREYPSAMQYSIAGQSKVWRHGNQ